MSFRLLVDALVDVCEDRTRRFDVDFEERFSLAAGAELACVVGESLEIGIGIKGRSPQSWAAYPVLVDCLLAQGKVSAADELTADLLPRHRSEPDLLVARGLSLSRSGRLHEAVTFIDRAIDIRLDHPRGHEALATLLELRNDPRPRCEVSVVAPTIGTAFVRQAIESVQQQRYPLVRHFIVADGPECHDRVADMGCGVTAGRESPAAPHAAGGLVVWQFDAAWRFLTAEPEVARNSSAATVLALQFGIAANALRP